MTTELDPEQAARVARLAQRRGGTAKPAAPAATTQAVTPPVAPTPAPPAATVSPRRVQQDPAAWAPPANYRPVRYTQPIAITVAQATSAAAASASVAASTVPMNEAAVRATSAVPVVSVVDRTTNLPVTKSRRRHAAAAGRVIATGLATSGFLGTITALAQADHQATDESNSPSPDSSVVVRTVERTIYVDENGNPVAPPSSIAAAVDSTLATVPGVTLPLDTTTLPGAPAPTVLVVPGAPTPAPAPAPAPAPSGGGTKSTPAPAPATTAPAPVTTAAPPPPPPPTTVKATTTTAPACTGSKCG